MLINILFPNFSQCVDQPDLILPNWAKFHLYVHCICFFECLLVLFLDDRHTLFEGLLVMFLHDMHMFFKVYSLYFLTTCIRMLFEGLLVILVYDMHLFLKGLLVILLDDMHMSV